MDIIAWCDAQIEELQEVKTAHLAAVDASYAKGYADGKDAVELPEPTNPDAQYTQAQMNDAVNTGKDEVRAELQPQLDAIASELAEVKASIEPAKADAVATFKADLKAKYEEQQVAEQAGETGFGALLA